ncbi:MAG: ROK family transcriptional regulator [Pseudomonadota bacterium]
MSHCRAVAAEAPVSWPGDERSNAALVLEAVRSRPRIARVEVSRRTGLSPPTVTSVTADLIAAGLLAEMPLAEPEAGRRGRPRVGLRVRGEAHCVVGGKLADRALTLALLDFSGVTLAEQEMPMAPGPAPPERVADAIAAGVARIAAEGGLATDDISAIGIGVPGFVDGERGRVHWSRSFDRRDVDLAGLLEGRFACPVFTDNDANLVAMAELRFGLGRDVKNFVAVTLESGLGMGIVIDGRVYRGARHKAAELGHTKVALDGALCTCGQRGCLEAYVAEYALLREADVIVGPARGGDAEAGMTALYAAAEAGHPRAVEIFRRAGRMFGLGLANVVNIFDPSLIVLSGGSMRYRYLHDETVLAEMRANIIMAGDPPPRVEVHEWGDLLWAKGAAALALDGITELALARLSRSQRSSAS